MLKIQEGITIGGTHLYLPEMEVVHRFYERANTQEYLVENYNLTEEDAWNKAYLVRSVMAEKELSETEAIDFVLTKLKDVSGF